MTVYDYIPRPGDPGGEGGPTYDRCQNPGCGNTEDIRIQEASPGRKWLFSSSVCGHWGFIFKKPEPTS